jgi:hypothetical protein
LSKRMIAVYGCEYANGNLCVVAKELNETK